MSLPLILIAIISLIIFALVFAIILPGLTILFTFPPSISTERRMVRDVKNEISKKLANSQKFYDLGSGSGKVCFSIAKKFPQMEIIGVEKFKLVYLLARAKLFFLPYKNLNLVNGDFFTTNISEADFIFMFLTKSFLDKLTNKLLLEAKTGCLIFSNNFPIERLGLYKKIEYRDFFTQRYLYIYKI